YFDELVDFLSSGPLVSLVLEGREAVSAVRAMHGKTDGAQAAPGTVRGDFGLSTRWNLVHASDSEKSAAREISLWFPEVSVHA
ncbi:MAG: nucleoside-diphosphate kinase, partial [Cutibacterium granulosum]|nr:nucleoside-diphosphate kinase [Cutibacterium granulosum]